MEAVDAPHISRPHHIYSMLDHTYLVALSLIVANVMSGALKDEIEDVFGTTIMYHPLTIWIVLFAMIFVNTRSYRVALIVIAVYEATKFVWRAVKPEPGEIARMRKLIHRTRQHSDLDDEDVDFLNKITPENVAVAKKERRPQAYMPEPLA